MRGRSSPSTQPRARPFHGDLSRIAEANKKALGRLTVLRVPEGFRSARLGDFIVAFVTYARLLWLS